MNLVWCEEHKSSGEYEALEPNKYRCTWAELFRGASPCRFVEKQLVSKDALVIERDGDGWPEWVHVVANQMNEGWRCVLLLDALAEAQQRGSECSRG